ncbi:hypothetical protein ACFX2H_026648 [Malus domestica]
MELEASELPKSIVLGRDENIHIRLTGSSPLGDVGSYNSSPLRAQRPRRHTSGQRLALISNCHIPARAPTTSRAQLRRSTILSALGPDHALTVLGQRLALISNCHIPARAQLRRSTILSALGPNHAFTVLFLGTHTRTSQWVTHHGIVLMQTCLTSEFQWNPKPVSSQNASC